MVEPAGFEGLVRKKLLMQPVHGGALFIVRTDMHDLGAEPLIVALNTKERQSWW
jgi:hypothetical protein